MIAPNSSMILEISKARDGDGMKRTVVSTFCLILILGSQVRAQGQNSLLLKESESPSRFSADWRLRLSGTEVKDEQSQSKVVDLRTEIKAKYLLHSSLYLDIQPSMRLQAGQTQSIDGADKPENKIYLYQAAAHYRPASFFRTSAGALNQRYMHTGLLVDAIAFPAVRAETLFKTDSTKSVFAIESAIPTSTSLSTSSKELESTPSLNSAMLKTSWETKAKFEGKISLGYFAYNNLPSTIAQKSGLLGNEINKISDANYAFSYKYEGFELATELQIPVSSNIDLITGAEYLVNQKAPAKINQATTYFGRASFHVSKSKDLIIGGSYFTIAPESAVSYFNASAYETNRVGYSAETSFAFKKEGYSFGLRYSDAEVLYSNAIQSREKTLLIKLETFYANL